MMKKVKRGGGWPAVWYTLRKAREAGGIVKLWKAMRTKNACKTCALGMGGQEGGMVNEAGHFPEVCKKSLQAMAADMQGAIQPRVLRDLLDRATAGVLAARAGILRPARHAAAATSTAHSTIGRSTGTRRSTASPRKLKQIAPSETLLVLQRPQLERGRLSAAAVRPAVRHQQRQQLQLLLPPGQRRGARPAPSAAARRRSRWTTSSTPTWCS